MDTFFRKGFKQTYDFKVKLMGLGGWELAGMARSCHGSVNTRIQGLSTCRKLDVMTCIYNPSAGRQTGRSLELMASQLSQWVNSRFNELGSSERAASPLDR